MGYCGKAFFFAIVAALVAAPVAQAKPPVYTGKKEHFRFLAKFNTSCAKQGPGGAWVVFGCDYHHIKPGSGNGTFSSEEAGDYWFTGYGDGVFTSMAFNAQEHISYSFPDGSTMEVMGKFFAPDRRTQRSIVGGTGRYRGAHGTVYYLIDALDGQPIDQVYGNYHVYGDLTYELV